MRILSDRLEGEKSGSRSSRLFIAILFLLLASVIAMPLGAAVIGEIGNNISDNIFFEEGYFRQPDYIQLSPNIYAVAYVGNQTRGFIKTYHILDDGTVNNTIGSFIFEENISSQPELIRLNGSSTMYALVYGDKDSDGMLKTINITTEGNVMGIVDSYEYDTTQGLYPEIINIYNQTYAISYQGSGADGYVRTINISSNGSIRKSSIDFLEFDTADCISDPKLIKVTGETYAVAYEGTGNDGFVKTMNITNTGSISNTVSDSYEFDNNSGYRPDIIKVGEGMFAVAYRGMGDDGFMITLNVSATGKITNSSIDTLEFDTLYAYDTQILPIAGETYAIAYRGDGTDGFVRTVNVTSMGQISNTYSDSLEFDTAYGIEPRILPVSGNVYSIVYAGDLFVGYIKSANITATGDISAVTSTYSIGNSVARMPSIVQVGEEVYAVAYMGADYDGFVQTVNISANGTIYGLIDKYEFDTTQGLYPQIYNIDGDIYAIAYQGASADGFVRTINISSNGSIMKSSIDFLEFDTANCISDPKLIKVAGETYAVAYESTGNDGFIKTLNITNTGTISNTVSDSYEFDPDNGTRPDIVAVGGGIFAISYTGNGTDGYVITVNISAEGGITKSAIDIIEFDAADGVESRIINTNGSVYAIAYRGTGADGFLRTISITPAGIISDAIIDFLEFDAADGYEPDLIPISGTIYAVAYRGTAGDGFIKTISILNSGLISNSVTDTLEFDTFDGYLPAITKVGNDSYAIAYATTAGYEGAITTIYIKTQDILPIIESISPDNDFVSIANITSFFYNVTDDIAISSCELVMNGVSRATNSTIILNTTLQFTIQNLAQGEYSWNINCTDSGNQEVSSETRMITSIPASKFTGRTTNLSAIDIENITNLVLDIPGSGMINFSEIVNLSGGVNLNANVNISAGSAIINSVNAPALNKSAIITLYSLGFEQMPALFKDGIPCADCSIIEYNGNLTFGVPHFTNYTASANAELMIWDEADSIRKEVGDGVLFYANYTNITNEQAINGTGVWCSISFPDMGATNMTYDPDKNIYLFSRSFSTDNTFNYDITCDGSAQGFEPLTLSDSLSIAPEVYGPRNNSQQFNTLTTVNIINSRPEITKISCNDSSSILLNAGSTKEVQCTVDIMDFNGGNTITNVNSTFHYFLNSSGDPDDNNTHYTNSSCSELSADGFNSTWGCSFNIWYYANNGSWIINMSVTDDYPYTVSNATNATILPLYAINVTPTIDFGNMAVGDISPMINANITNLGNMRINTTVYGFGGETDSAQARTLAMICEHRNISISNERYSTDPIALYDSMSSLSGTPTQIHGISIPKQTLPSVQMLNFTYWRLYVNESSNPFGQCNGTVIFSAEAS